MAATDDGGMLVRMSATATFESLPRGLRRRLFRDRVRRRWTAAWLGASILGIANGVIREAAYADRIGEQTANQVSGATLVALLAGYFCARAGLPEIPQAPHVRRLQREQGGTALPWAARMLGLPPPV